jgi:hypothetical protein
MTDETFDRIRDFVKHNSIPGLGRAGHIPIYVSDEVPDDDPDLSEGEYAIGLRLSPADYADLERRVKKLRERSMRKAVIDGFAKGRGQ